MEIKKVLPFAVVAYVLPFVITGTVSVLLGGKFFPIAASPLIGFIGIAAMILFVASSTVLALKKPVVEEGILFGVLVAAVALVIQIALGAASSQPLGTVTTPVFGATLVLIVAVAGAAAFFKSKMKKK